MQVDAATDSFLGSTGAPRGVLGRLRDARLNMREVAGSLGDMGTFLPLLVGMASQNGLNFAAALFFTGLFNFLTGLAFSIPMAVQPMKAIAAVALTEGLTVPQILAAGASVSIVILVFGVTGLIGWLNRVIPRSVVRGVQLSLGLSLMVKGLQLVAGTKVWLAPDGYLTAVLCVVVVLALLNSRIVPAAVVLFVGGIALAFWEQPAVAHSLHLGFTLPTWSPPAWHDFATSFPKAALPQIPLTTLNSVIAVCALSADLFPQRRAEPRKVAVSVGVMNLVGVWFGAMPMCHGAGGLAGQYRFGARTNGSILFLGVTKMVVAVLLGSSLMAWCGVFPASILGVMVVFSGLELALIARDQTAREDASVMLVIAGLSLGLNNIGLAVLVGLGLAWWFKWRGGLEKAREEIVVGSDRDGAAGAGSGSSHTGGNG